MRALLVLALLTRVASADDEIVKGAVVKVEAQEVYISLGADRGVHGGAQLRLKRSISLRHPVTKAQVEDWVPIGSATVTQAGAVMSRAVVGELVDQIRIGDIAEVLVDRTDAPAVKPPPPDHAVPATPVDPQTAEVLGVFAAQSGQPIETRIAAWERYLSMRPTSPYADGVRKDLDALHTLRDAMRPPQGAGNELIARLAHAPPTVAFAGQPVPLVFVIDEPDRVAAAYLHFRARGSRTYRRMLLAREREIYVRGTIPADVVAPPGFDYFVEVSAPSGRSGLAFASAEQPAAVAVAPPTLLDRFGSRPGLSSVKLQAAYLDFATFDKRAGDHTDTMVMATVDFTYRLSSHVESVGVGYGVYSGSGGYADRTWIDASPIPKSGFHYGYADVEVGGDADGVHVSGGAQVIAGVGKDGFGLGVEGRLRLGERDHTNLALAARTVDQVGFLADIRFGTRPLQKMLLDISVGATNQPNEGDIGVRLGTDVEVLAINNVSILLGGSWQGRSIRHGGIGAGGGIGVYW
jgi:hypothetical protein